MFLITWPLIFILKIIISFLGIFLTPFCLIGVDIEKEYSKWEMVKLNKLGWLFENLRDGCIGDVRLDYWNNGKQYPSWFDSLPMSQYIKAYYWIALRNPFNRNRYIPLLGCDMRVCEVTLLAGQEFVSDTKKSYGWQFVKTSGPIFNYYGFYLYKPWRSKFIRIRLGHKIEPRYNDKTWNDDPSRASKSWKGTTFGINLRGER